MNNLKIKFGKCKPFGFFTLLFFVFHSVCIFAQEPVMEWARQIGGPGGTSGISVTTDGFGNVYSTGFFDSTSDFNPSSIATANLTAVGKKDVYISKLNASGDFVWAQRIGQTGDNQGMSIKADSVGNIYVVGQFVGDLEFTTNSGLIKLTAIGKMDAFILKMDSSGTLIWAKTMGGVLPDGDKIAFAVTSDGQYVYVTGTVNIKNPDIFVSKLDISGNFIWTKTMGGSRAEYSWSIAVDKSGSVYTVGKFSSDSVDFNPGSGRFYLKNSVPVTAVTSYDGFISKLDSSGEFVWAKGIGGVASSDECTGVAIDNDDNVYVSGNFASTVDFNLGGTPVPMTASGNIDVFVCKLTNAGKLTWAKRLGGTSITFARGIAVDDIGNAYTSGRFMGITDFNPSTGVADTFKLGPAATGHAIFISKLDSSGEFVWAKRYGDGPYAYGFSITIDKNRSLYGAGWFSGNVNFDTALGSANLQSFGGTNAFVFKINQFCLDTSSSSITIEECLDEFKFNGITYKESGQYVQKFTNASNCDSLVILNLNLKGSMVHPLINVDSFLLSTVLTYVTYQWILDGKVISGATNSTLLVSKNGDYQVAVSNGEGCLDTSEVYTINNVVGINLDRSKYTMDFYPNPTKDMVYMTSSISFSVLLTNLEGRLIKRADNPSLISLKELPAGVYLLRFQDQQGRFIKVEKLIRMK